MLLKYFYDDRLAQASYLLGCPGGGVAVVIDPSREIAPYLRAAEENGLRIIGALETHIHADYVSGGRELAATLGVPLYISSYGDAPLNYDIRPAEGMTVVPLRDGDVIEVGAVKVEAWHTPGHTPEHMSYVVTDNGADHPIGVFSGDCLFAGDVGRPDLLDATGMANESKEGGARQQYDSIHRLAGLGDYVQVWPGHGAGSACGKALGAVPSTTIGYEKLFNPAYQHENAADFSAWLLEGQPEAPRYFAQMKRVNRVGADLLHTLGDPQTLDTAALPTLLEDGALVIDTRSVEAFAERFVPGTLNVPANEGQFNTWVGWYVDFEQPVYLIAEADAVSGLVRDLRAVGVDHIGGTFTPDAIDGATESLTVLNPSQVADRLANGAILLDVRGQSERNEDYIDGSRFLPMGYVPDRVAELPRDSAIITQCGGGVRSQVVASLLRRYGFREVINMSGGIDAWKRAGLPVVREAVVAG